MEPEKPHLDRDIDVLIVEDSPTQAMELTLFLQIAGYDVRAATNGKEGLEQALAKKPDIIISDVQMPLMDGFALCDAVKTSPALMDVPLILLTTLSDVEDIVRGLASKADAYVTKPYEWDFLESQIRYQLAGPFKERSEKIEEQLVFTYKDALRVITSTPERILSLLLSVYEDAVLRNQELIQTKHELEMLNQSLEEKVAQRTESLAKEIEERKAKELELMANAKKLQKAMHGSLQAMASTMGIRDPAKAAHQVRTSKLAAALAAELGLSRKQADGIRMAAVIHDLGMMAVPMEVLGAPRRLTSQEFARIRLHPQVAFQILQNVPFPWPLAHIILQHHERMDGSGYPFGLAAEKIFAESRVLAVADVVEAMVSARPWRPALSVETALQEIQGKKGKLYDPDVADACVKLFTERGFSFE